VTVKIKAINGKRKSSLKIETENLSRKWHLKTAVKAEKSRPEDDFHLPGGRDSFIL